MPNTKTKDNISLAAVEVREISKQLSAPAQIAFRAGARAMLKALSKRKVMTPITVRDVCMILLEDRGITD